MREVWGWMRYVGVEGVLMKYCMMIGWRRCAYCVRIGGRRRAYSVMIGGRRCAYMCEDWWEKVCVYVGVLVGGGVRICGSNGGRRCAYVGGLVGGAVRMWEDWWEEVCVYVGGGVRICVRS